ncbi:MAG: transcription-repair coupling factor [Planctomycetota bacterium]
MTLCATAGEKKRLEELLSDEGGALARGVHPVSGYLTEGFEWPALGLAVVPYHQAFGRPAQPGWTEGEEPPPAPTIHDFLDLSIGDRVVHAHHGIAKYQGTREVIREGVPREFLLLEFREGERLYVPVDAVDLVQRYVGVGNLQPNLHRLGGRVWKRQKAEVREAVTKLALEMIEIQAARAARPGIAAPPDSRWQWEFEASFPFNDTPDQTSATESIRKDMQMPVPMDRLICGDVGYGKTEVALRAAFKAVETGWQVAVLVPTTILAEQHGRTFMERLADYPFVVEILSRFKTRGEQRAILERTASGGVDILIGTHRLIQPDVRFKDLGLVVIDEEQRFGVRHKEFLKHLRSQVDVLTMTATPIPRTLHMALLGLRDISNLTTPPAGRMAVHTEIVRFDRARIREAILRELDRDGQVYFVHNRVESIHAMAQALREIIPEATFGVVHGQMKKAEIREVMRAFLAGSVDVLVTTTIIESGVDIPNVNTLFINRAHEFGLADLHQLRGRVGRFKHRAFAYLILPKRKPISPTAEKRVKAIEEYTELGAGFKIALRDLEIRGAGNILGAEQSGHIASVGYDMYCRLLREAVEGLSGKGFKHPLSDLGVDLPVSAFLPDDYVVTLSAKMDLYRRAGHAGGADALARIRRELQDRFGELPPPAEAFLLLTRLKQVAKEGGVDSLVYGEGGVYLRFSTPEKSQTFLERHGEVAREYQEGHLRVTPPEEAKNGPELVQFLLEVFESGSRKRKARRNKKTG